MNRLTTTLSEHRYRALKEAAAQRNKTVGSLIEESLEFYGTKLRADARELVRQARDHSKLGESDALAVAQEQVNTVRRQQRRVVRALRSSSTPIGLSPGRWPYMKSRPSPVAHGSTACQLPLFRPSSPKRCWRSAA